MGNKAIRLKDIHNNTIYTCPYYPVGSIYLSINNTNPSEWFGGSWEQIKEVFLFACSDKYKAGTTGGEAQHELTKEEIPHLGSGVAYGGNSIASGSGWSDTWLGSGDTGKAHNNMPPYLSVYMWKRIA